jgi:hypothetical protein
VFYASCSKDYCQQRIESIPKESSDYIDSGALSMKVKEFNDNARPMLEFLKANTNFCEVNTELSFNNSLDQMYSSIEPEIIHIRPGASSNDLRKEITIQLEDLKGEDKWWNLEINNLIREENERKT